MKEEINILFFEKSGELLHFSMIDKSNPDEFEGQISTLFWKKEVISNEEYSEIEDTLIKAKHLDHKDLAKKLANNKKLGLQKVKDQSLKNLARNIFDYLIDSNLSFDEFDEEEMNVKAKVIKIK